MEKNLKSDKNVNGMNKIQKIHDALLREFGSQFRWPVTSEGKFHPEYSNGPKNAEKAIVKLNKNRKLVKILMN